MVGQAFVCHHARLARIDVLLATYARKDDHPIIFHLRESPSSADDIITITVDAVAVKDNVYHQFKFPPLLDSSGRSYYFFLESPQSVPGNAITIWHSPTDAYAEGELYIDGRRQEGDLAFRTYYDYSLRAMTADIWDGIMHNIPLIFLATAFFLLPGYVLFTILLPRSEFDLTQRLIVSVGLSVAFYPLLLLVCTLLGVRLNALRATAILAICGGIVAWSAAKEFLRRGDRMLALRALAAAMRVKDIHLLLGLIFGLTLVTRLLLVRDLSIPMWGDSYTHTIVSQLIINKGGIPDSYRPYSPTDSFIYHFGFHSLVACLHWLSGLSVIKAVILVGQILNALTILGVYLLAERLMGNQTGALISALIVGLVSKMPAYYVNWGRYTQLAGQTILPIAMVLLMKGVERDKKDCGSLGAASITLAGLVLTHYIVSIFYGIFVVSYLLYETYLHHHARGEVFQLWSRVLWVCLGAFLLVSPWVYRLLLTYLPKALSPRQVEFGPTFVADYFAFGSLSFFISYPLVAISLLGALLGLLRRERAVILLILWVLLLFLVANAYLTGLPLSGTVNNATVLMALYIPASILCGFLLGQLGIRARFEIRPLAGLLIVFFALLGARNMLSILEPGYALAMKPDEMAMSWIKENTPTKAKFVVNSGLGYSGTLAVCTDGGQWIHFLTGREITVPPLYLVPGFTSDKEINKVNALAKATINAIDDEGTLELLQREGATHVYLGSRGGSIQPDILLNSSRYRLVYHKDGVWIFEINYDFME